LPKQTFFNLDERKQQTLLEALRQEFSRVSVHEASIANIVKGAAIPRGSFYQYFNDKEDAFLYLLEYHGKTNKETLLCLLKEHQGDLFLTMEELYRYLYEKYSNEAHYKLFRNAFLNMNQKIEETMTKNVSANQLERELNFISEQVAKEQLSVESAEELMHALKMIKAVTFHNLIDAFQQQLSVDEACRRFKIELGLLKRGLQKRNA